MILSFKEQLPEKIMNGTKIHSIRTDPHNRWKAGRKIHMATGVRTKNYNCFNETVCTAVQSIHCSHDELGILRVWIDRYPLDYGTIKMLAANDGFGSVKDFRQWFNTDFKGKIIHWTDLRY